MVVFGNNILLVVELDFHVACDGEDVDYDALAVGGVNDGVNGRHQRDLALVCLLLIAQTAHKSAASARDLCRVDRQSLLLRHFDRDLNEVRKESRAAKLASANAESADHSRFVADADLTKLDTGAENGCKILDERAEVNSTRRGEEEYELGVVKRVLRVNELHIEPVIGDLSKADLEGLALTAAVILVVSLVLLCSRADNGAKGRDDLIFGHFSVRDDYVAELESLRSLNDSVSADAVMLIFGIEIIYLASVLKADTDYLGTLDLLGLLHRHIGKNGIERGVERHLVEICIVGLAERKEIRLGFRAGGKEIKIIFGQGGEKLCVFVSLRSVLAVSSVFALVVLLVYRGLFGDRLCLNLGASFGLLMVLFVLVLVVIISVGLIVARGLFGRDFCSGSLCGCFHLGSRFLGAVRLVMSVSVVMMSFMIGLLLAGIFGGRLLVFVVFQNFYSCIS